MYIYICKRENKREKVKRGKKGNKGKNSPISGA
jgi:hypothetical protein